MNLRMQKLLALTLASAPTVLAEFWKPPKGSFTAPHEVHQFEQVKFQDALADETPEDVLHSGVCKEYIDHAYKEVYKIIDNEPEGAIANYLCSHISLTLAADKVKEAKETVAVEQNPCAKALKESWAEAEESINLLMESSEECHAEVGKQIVDSKGGSVNSYVRVDEEEGHSTVSVSKFISREDLLIACIAWCGW